MVDKSDIRELSAYQYNQLALQVVPTGMVISAVAVCLLSPFPGRMVLVGGCLLLALGLVLEAKFLLPHIRTSVQLDAAVFGFHLLCFSLLWIANYQAPTRWSPVTLSCLIMTSGILFTHGASFVGTAFLGASVWLAIKFGRGVPVAQQESLQLLLFSPVIASILRYAIGRTNEELQQTRTREQDTILQLKQAMRQLSDETSRRLDYESQLRNAQKTESLGLLAAGAAHDFNNALLAISAFAENIELASECSDSRELAAEISKAVEQASGICQQMLTYAGRSSEEQSQVNLSRLTREILRLLQVSVRSGVSVSLNCDLEDAVIMGNRTQLQQVMMNLIVNASEAIDGIGAVSVELTEQLFSDESQDFPAGVIGTPISPGTYYRLNVSDTGCGIPDETMQQMFDPYFTTKESGHGFGLSVVLGIVQSHQASMIIDSTVGAGTSITLLFPAFGSDIEDTGEFRDPRHSVDLRPAPRRILVVDDEVLVRTPMAEMLRLMNWDVVEVGSGAEALGLLNAGNTYSVLVIDYQMPDMNGLETLRNLRAAGCESPALLCSGYISDSEKDAAMIDFDGFLPKPFRRVQLEQILSTIPVPEITH